MNHIFEKYWDALTTTAIGAKALSHEAVRLALLLAIKEASADQPTQSAAWQREAESAIGQIGRLNEWLEQKEIGLYSNPNHDTAGAILSAVGYRDQQLAIARAELASALADVTALGEELRKAEAMTAEQPGYEEQQNRLMRWLIDNEPEASLACDADKGVAGVIIALWGVSPVFALNALSFVAMLVALWMMDPSKLSRPEPKRTRGGVREAIRYVAGSRDLSVPLALMAVLGTLGFNFQVIIPILAERSFDGNVAAYSLLMIAMGIGSIAGAVIFGARNKASKAVIAGAAAGFGIAALLAATAPTLALEMLALAVLGLCSVTFAAGINSGLQLAAAPDMRGRVMALYSIVFLGSTPLGGPLAGWLGESVGPRAPLVLAGVAALAVAAAAALLWSERRPAVTETVAAFRERISERRPRPVRIVRRRGEHSAPETGSHPVVRRS